MERGALGGRLAAILLSGAPQRDGHHPRASQGATGAQGLLVFLLTHCVGIGHRKPMLTGFTERAYFCNGTDQLCKRLSVDAKFR